MTRRLAHGVSAALFLLMAALPLPAGQVPAPQGGEWPRFRGPSGMGISDARGLPLSWSQTENIAWRLPMPGPGASSPVVFGDHIYITCYTGYFIPGQPGGSLEQLKRHLIAVRRADGTILWNQAIPAKLPEEPRIRDHGYAASTPAVDSERVYVFFGKSGVFAFDRSGKQLWHADVGSKTNGWGSAASPVIYKDLLIVNASVESDSLVALDRRTGREVWRAGGIRESWNTPIIATAPSGRQELLLAVMGSVLAFDPDSGRPLWSCRTDIRWYMVPSVIVGNGVVFSIGGRSGIASLAVRMGGSGEVTATHRLWTSENGANVSSPVYHDGHLYYMHQDAFACCIRADNGQLVYRERLGRGGQVYASLLLAEGRIYATTRNGITYVLPAAPRFEQLAVNNLSDGSIFNASPAVAGSRIFIRSDKFLYCIGR